jgi:hypothetical protein
LKRETLNAALLPEQVEHHGHNFLPEVGWRLAMLLTALELIFSEKCSRARIARYRWYFPATRTEQHNFFLWQEMPGNCA